MQFEGEEWLYFPAISPDVAIIRATTADERGNLTFEHEGAYLGAMELALAAHNCGGKVIAQVKRIAQAGTLKPHDVRVPGILVDFIVEAPDQLQTTATPYDPAISGEVFRPLESFRLAEFDVAKVIARRVAMELQPGWAVNIGFGISANVPRIFLEEGRHGDVTWVIEQGAVGGVPLLDFKFGCSSNAEAFVASPHQFTYFQAAGFDASLLSFLQIDRDGSVNVSKLSAAPACDGRRRRIRRHHLARQKDRLLAAISTPAPSFRSPTAGSSSRRKARSPRSSRRSSRFRSPAGAPCAGPGCDLCHRALRHEAHAERPRRHRDRARCRSRTRHIWGRRRSRLRSPRI